MIQLIVNAFVEKRRWGSRQVLYASSDHEKGKRMKS